MPTPHLPAELLDHVVDHLHDTEDALRNCCLVSKSWIRRTRRHLFASIEFPTASYLRSWKNTFPYSPTSPACYTTFMSIRFPLGVTAADAEEGGWIPTFSRVVHLMVYACRDDTEESLTPFHGLSPVLKSLCLTYDTFQPSPVFDFIRSFPLLEDLAVVDLVHGSINDDDEDFDWQLTTIQPPNPPNLTGALALAPEGTKTAIRRLLSLPGGPHFRKLNFRWSCKRDVPLMMALVEGCCSSLESIEIGLYDTCAFV
jgi:hypothetical protein